MVKKRGLFNKKAASYLVWFMILEIILIGIISIGLTDFLISVKEDTLFEKNYLSKDIGLITTTINFAPADIKYVYSLKKDKISLSNFNFEWQDNEVRVYENISRLKTSFPFMSDKEAFSAHLRSPVEIVFQNKDNKLEIMKNE